MSAAGQAGIGTTTPLLSLLAGMLVMGYAVSALFFLRFWRETRDRLFAFFAVAFFVLALQRTMISLTVDRGEDSVPYYTMRLFAFVLIVIAIIDKNRGDPSP